mmetsp:Transcript_36888/g.92505  ORF Transcript_36888/g.92505 Transcript_36888/m.92505 type:complete len:102 (-) Transcript_36888:735-1040(-)
MQRLGGRVAEAAAARLWRHLWPVLVSAKQPDHAGRREGLQPTKRRRPGQGRGVTCLVWASSAWVRVCVTLAGALAYRYKRGESCWTGQTVWDHGVMQRMDG